jgi:hypothetical protein
MGLSRAVVCEYGLWVLWVLGSGRCVLVLLALALKLDSVLRSQTSASSHTKFWQSLGEISKKSKFKIT